MSNLKPGEILVAIRICFTAVNDIALESLTNGIHEQAYGIWLVFGLPGISNDEFHAAVAQISNVSGYRVTACDPPSRPAKADSLNGALENESPN